MGFIQRLFARAGNGTAATTGQGRPTSGGWNGFGSLGFAKGYDAPDPGSYRTYRQMRANPTIAIGRAVATAPIKAAGWAFQEDDDAPDGALELVQDALDPLADKLLHDLMYGLDYGWAGFELVWDEVAGKILPRRIKPLAPELTTILVDTGGLVMGLRNREVDLNDREYAVWSYDPECDDPYGRSRYENIRESAWCAWLHAFKRAGNYVDKGAGIIPMVQYPNGRGVDQFGATYDNGDTAMRILTSLGRGAGVTMPVEFAGWAEDMVRAGTITPDQAMAWQIKFLETRSGVGGEILELMKHYEALMLRGLFVPERAVTEGQFGTKAEADSHADIAMLIAEQTLASVCGFVNHYAVDAVLSLNYGPDAAGKVYAVANPIRDTEKAFFRDLMRQVLVNPSNIDLLMAWLDVDTALDRAGLPKAAEVVENADPAAGVADAVVKDVLSPPSGASGNTAAVDVSLNGAQITAMVGLIQSAAAKQIPQDAFSAILQAAYPQVDPALIAKIVASTNRFQLPSETAPPISASMRGLYAYIQNRLAAGPSKGIVL